MERSSSSLEAIAPGPRGHIFLLTREGTFLLAREGKLPSPRGPSSAGTQAVELIMRSLQTRRRVAAHLPMRPSLCMQCMIFGREVHRGKGECTCILMYTSPQRYINGTNCFGSKCPTNELNRAIHVVFLYMITTIM